MKYLELKRELEKQGIETHNSINYKKGLDLLKSHRYPFAGYQESRTSHFAVPRIKRRRPFGKV